MNKLSENSKNCKKYSSLKNCKCFGRCIIATMLAVGVTVGGTSNIAYALDSVSPPEVKHGNAENGYEVYEPRGKRYVRNDNVESHEPVLKTRGQDGVTYILKDMLVDGSDEYFFNYRMEDLFKELYLKAEFKLDENGKVKKEIDYNEFMYENDDVKDDGEPEDKYVRADANTLNLRAGKVDPETGEIIPRVSIINPKYPHRIDDKGLVDDAGNDLNKPDGYINNVDYKVISNKEITVNKNSEENVVNDDGSVVLSKYFKVEQGWKRIGDQTEYFDMKDDIYEVGTKPRIVTEELPSPKRYVKDDTKEKGTPNEEVFGTAGAIITTTTYEVDPNTGEVT